MGSSSTRHWHFELETFREGNYLAVLAGATRRPVLQFVGG